MHTDTILQYFQPSDTRVHLQLLRLTIHYTIIYNGRFQIDECHECKWRYDRCTCTIGLELSGYTLNGWYPPLYDVLHVASSERKTSTTDTIYTCPSVHLHPHSILVNIKSEFISNIVMNSLSRVAWEQRRLLLSAIIWTENIYIECRHRRDPWRLLLTHGLSVICNYWNHNDARLQYKPVEYF